MNVSPLFFLGAVGGLFPIMALAVDAASRFSVQPPKLISYLGKRVKFRPDKDEVENLRQALVFVGNCLLGIYAVVAANWVYIGLQALLLCTTSLWYLRFSEDINRSEALKRRLGLITSAVIVAVLSFHGTAGFHLVGMSGLVILSAAYLISRPLLLRDGLALLGALLLSTYGVLGMLFDAAEQFEAHLVWTILNITFSLVGSLVFAHSFHKMRSVRHES